MKKNIIAILVSQALLTSAFATEKVSTLDEVVVIATENAERATFKQKGAVSIRGEEQKMQNLDSVVRSLPGTYTNIDPTQGTISVNLRGMNGFGRVNTSIDGVPQTLFSTSANGASRYHDREGASTPSSQFGTSIDPNFLGSLRVEKGYAHGADGINSLAGSAELKTLDIDDVLEKNRKVGVLSKFATGSNDYGYNVMTTVAGRTQAFSSTGNIGGLFGYALRKSGNNYKDGNGNRHSDLGYVSNQTQRPTSWLGKLELNFNDQNHLKFSGRNYQTNIGGRKLENENYSVDYQFNADSPLLNPSLLASHSKNYQTYNHDSLIWTLSESASYNTSNYFRAENQSLFEFAQDHSLTLTVGASHLTNRYQRKAKIEDGESSQDSFIRTPFAPAGVQKINGAYVNSDYRYGIYGLEAGLTYQKGTFSGFKPACEEYIPCFPQGEAQIKRSYRSFDPSVRLSADFNDWFNPFISYSKSQRLPNIQEVFFNNEGGGSMNPHLKPEKANTYQIGFNTLKYGVFNDSDHLGFKAVHYRSKVKNYITSETFYINKERRLTNDLNDADVGSFQAQIAINTLEPVQLRGTEIELNYHSDRFYTTLTYSHQKTSQPIGIQSSVNGFGYGDIYQLPKHVATLDIGTHWLNKSLTLGTTLHYHGTAYRILPLIDGDIQKPRQQKLPSKPITADVYAMYQFNPNVSLKFSIQNAFNSAYIDPLNSQNGQRVDYDVDEEDNDVFRFSNYARGRTYVVGGEIRF